MDICACSGAGDDACSGRGSRAVVRRFKSKVAELLHGLTGVAGDGEISRIGAARSRFIAQRVPEQLATVIASARNPALRTRSGRGGDRRKTADSRRGPCVFRTRRAHRPRLDQPADRIAGRRRPLPVGRPAHSARQSVRPAPPDHGRRTGRGRRRTCCARGCVDRRTCRRRRLSEAGGHGSAQRRRRGFCDAVGGTLEAARRLAEA